MKYTVTYSCGHEGTVELFGTASDREKKLTWYQNSAVCPECYKAQQTAQEDEAVSKYDLPMLTGTEKQIAYAGRLRAKFVSENGTAMDDAIKAIAYLKTDAAKKKAEQLGKSLEEALLESLNRRPTIKKAYAVMTETESSAVIDLLH